MAEARKTVTVVFADVSGSTELGERLDPEALRRVMERYFSEARQALERHGGTVEKFIGDAVVGVFGIPTTHEDDAFRAVKAAAEMRQRFDALNETLESERGVSLAVRIGVNTGEVVAGDPAEGQFFATGDAVNVAARLEQAAGGGEILLGEQTYSLVHDAARVERHEPLRVKGKADALAAYRLLEIDESAPPVTRRFDTPFVGRDGELGRLAECFERAASEQAPVLVTVLGAAGIGKTRLAAEFVGSVERRGRVLQGRCLSYGEGITFWPLQEIVRGLTERPSGVPDPAEATSVEETFWAYRKLFAALAREGPLLVVLEDIHWAEATLLDLVEHIVEWTQDVPLMILCLARPELMDSRPGWPGVRIELEALGESEAKTLVQELGGGLDSQSQERAIMAADGNPLFLEQMLALASEEGNAEVGVPPTIQALLTTRLDQLEPDERALLEAAAVVGKEFWRSALVDLAPSTTEVSPLLQQLVRRRLIQPERSSLAGEDAFRFGHILIREAAYSSIPKEQRATLHERFAEWLEALRTPYDEIVGYHLEQAYICRADVGPLDQEALRLLGSRTSVVLEKGARRALGRGDYAAVANLLKRARNLSPPEDPRTLFLGVLLAEAHEAFGQLEEAYVMYRDTMSVAERVGDRRSEALARVNYVWLSSQMDPTSWPVDDMRMTASEAVNVFSELEDDFGLARAWRLSGQADWSLCLYEAAREADERVLLHAQRAGDEHGVRYSVIALAGEFLHGTTPVTEAISLVEALMQDHGLRNVSLKAYLLCVLASLHSASGRFSKGHALYLEAKALLEEMGLDYQVAASSMFMEEVGLLAGDADFAERELRAAYEELEARGEHGWRSTIAALLAEALLMLGRPSEAETYADVAMSVTDANDIASQARGRIARAKVLALRGNYEIAERLGHEAVALGARSDDLFMQSRLLMGLAEVLRWGGRDEAAIPVLREAVEVSERKQSLVTAASARAELEDILSAARTSGPA
jgi:class 3 adenylate cyclase/tetratricopeptide (TPR) repeat protein